MIEPVPHPRIADDLESILARTESLWEPLRGHSVFLTGGTGFFGRWLLESFAEANRRFDLGAHAVVLTRDPGRFRERAPQLAADPAIHLVPGDVRSFDAHEVRDRLAAPPQPFSHVLHAASETSEPANRDRPESVLETLYEGTRAALNFAFQTDAKNFLLVSSGAVYGEQPPALSHIPETHPGAPDLASPLSAYGEGKRVAEAMCHAAARRRGLRLRIARCFAFVGPHLALDAHYAIGNFIRDALSGTAIQVKGDGTPFRSYLYAADLAAWLWTLLLHPGAAGAYNVGSDQALSIRDVAECVSRNSPNRPPVSVAQRADPRRAPSRYVPDVQRARRELGLDVWTSLDAAVRKTLEFHQPQRTVL